MAKNSDDKKESGKDNRDGRLLEERSSIDAGLDEVMQEKLDTLGKIRDIVGVGGKLEKDIEAVTQEEDAIEGVISSIRGDLRRVTLEIKRLHEAVLKQESSGDTGGLRDIDSKMSEVHKQKTRFLKDLVLKERELDKVSARKTKVLDEYSNVLGKRYNLEEKLDEVESREIELKERKLDIESRIGKEIGDLTRAIYSIDSELEEVGTKSSGDVMAARKKPPSTRDLLKEGALGAKKQAVEGEEKIEPFGGDVGRGVDEKPKPPKPEPQEMGGAAVDEKPKPPKPKPSKPEPPVMKEKAVEGKNEPPGGEVKIKPSKEEVKEKAKGFLDFLGGGKGDKEPKLSGESIRLLKEILPVLDSLLGKLPDDKIEEFSTTDDYEVYNELFEKVSDYKGTGEQKEFINVNTKNILGVIDNLLENLPDEEIERFSSSDSFKGYNRLLDLFGV
ncbi:MAG: hypothetical protein B6U72_00045 [Candidatus Altiarchaeales archaeon ex4484_2]|nr:MAG: hypothetical protein B6U72_00045 [Candidatus Altiarchaeales archaeon ex4484_2]